jgi:dUTP pyrophosphatase
MIEMILTEKAKALSMIDFTPRRATDGSAGYDLKACIEEKYFVLPGEIYKIPTGVHIWIGSAAANCEALRSDRVKDAALLMPRSSLKGLQLTNAIGLIDEDYQGEYMVSVHNYTDDTITIVPGQSIVQLVFIKVFIDDGFKIVEKFSNSTVRSTDGFGSTGGHGG